MRPMRWLIGIGALVCAATWLTPFPAGGGWLWDLGNGLGFVALTLLLALNFVAGSSRLHRALAWTAVGMALAHGVWLLVLDAKVLEYLKPTMPAYMGAGLFALVLLAVGAATSGGRRRSLFYGRRSFRHLHWIWSALTISIAGYHIVGSGFYLNHYAGLALFIAVLAGCALWIRLPGRRRRAQARTMASESAAGLILGLLILVALVAVALVMPRNL